MTVAKENLFDSRNTTPQVHTRDTRENLQSRAEATIKNKSNDSKPNEWIIWIKYHRVMTGVRPVQSALKFRADYVAHVHS